MSEIGEAGRAEQVRGVIELERFSFSITGASLAFSAVALSQLSVDPNAMWPLRVAIVFLTICLSALYFMILNLKAVENSAYLVEITEKHTPALASAARRLGWFDRNRHERHYVWLRWVAAASALIGFAALALFFLIFALTK